MINMPWWYIWGYVAYCCATLTYWSFLLAGCAYIVFWKDHSGWWFLLAMTMTGKPYAPWRWFQLVSGEKTDRDGKPLPENT